MEFCEEISTPKNPVKLNIIPKVHAIFVHVQQSLKNQKEIHNVEFGLGFYSEQRFESSKSIRFKVQNTYTRLLESWVEKVHSGIAQLTYTLYCKIFSSSE